MPSTNDVFCRRKSSMASSNRRLPTHLQTTFPQQQIVRRHRHSLTTPMHHRAMESINLRCRRIDFQHAVELEGIEVVEFVVKSPHDLASFQTRFAVEITSVDVADALRLRRSKQEDVSWHCLVVGEMDDVADTQIPPCSLHVSLRLAAKRREREIVRMTAAESSIN
jgi:hypothetical protein